MIFNVSKKIKRMQSFQVAEKDERMEEHRPMTLGQPMSRKYQIASLSHDF